MKSIQLAKDNNREDLNFKIAENTFAYHNYYWVSCYEVYKENLDSAAYYCLLHLSEVEKYFGIDSKEFLCAILSPTIFSKSRKFVEDLDFGNHDEKYNDSLTIDTLLCFIIYFGIVAKSSYHKPSGKDKSLK